MMRKFEKLSNHEDAILPRRSTEHSAGYDLFSYEDVVIPGQLKIKHELSLILNGLKEISARVLDSTEDEEILALDEKFAKMVDDRYGDKEGSIFIGVTAEQEIQEVQDELFKLTLKEFGVDIDYLMEDFEKLLKPVLVKTGVKAKMMDDEFLALYNRSSGPKNNLILTNGVGVIDSDYYNNEDNEGHIMVQFINPGYNDVIIKKGDKIAQGVFSKFSKVDDEEEIKNKRISGHGSTGK